MSCVGERQFGKTGTCWGGIKRCVLDFVVVVVVVVAVVFPFVNRYSYFKARISCDRQYNLLLENLRRKRKFSMREKRLIISKKKTVKTREQESIHNIQDRNETAQSEDKQTNEQRKEQNKQTQKKKSK